MARAYFDAQNRHDIDGLMALFGEDGAFTDPNTGPTSGEELREFFAGSFEAFPDIFFEVDELFEGEGGRAAAQWRRRTGAPRPISPDGPRPASSSTPATTRSCPSPPPCATSCSPSDDRYASHQTIRRRKVPK